MENSTDKKTMHLLTSEEVEVLETYRHEQINNDRSNKFQSIRGIFTKIVDTFIPYWEDAGHHKIINYYCKHGTAYVQDYGVDSRIMIDKSLFLKTIDSHIDYCAPSFNKESQEKLRELPEKILSLLQEIPEIGVMIREY